MYQTKAIIRKVGNQFCVFSKDGTKNLGCSSSHEGAVRRLQEVEYFKHKGSSSMEYTDAFSNLGKAISGNIDPTKVGSAPEGTPTKVELQSSLADKLKTGSIAGQYSNKLLDSKEHFPVMTKTQAQSSLARVLSLAEVPVWYNGSLEDLRSEVRNGITKMHGDMKMSIALSDGQTPADTSMTSIKDPNDDRKKDLVPQVARPTLTTAECLEKLKNPEFMKVFAGRLMEILDTQIDSMKSAKKLAQELLDSGVTADKFDTLSTYLQQGVLSELMMSDTAVASIEDRRSVLLKRMNPNG